METMHSAQILLPVAAIVFLMIAVFSVTVISRITQMSRERIHPQQVRTRAEMATRVKDSRASDHLSNLFEAPVLFFFACILIYMLDISDGSYLALAWLFVLFRLVQAGVHLSFNNVRLRASVFGLGLLTLSVIWVRISLELITLG